MAAAATERTGPRADAARASLCSGRVKKTRVVDPQRSSTGALHRPPRRRTHTRNGSGGGGGGGVEWRRPLYGRWKWPGLHGGGRRKSFGRSPGNRHRPRYAHTAVKSAAAVLSQCRFVGHTQYTTHAQRSSATTPSTIIITKS